MAIQIPGFSMSLEASADLSAFQFHFVEVDSNGRVTISNGAGESVFGVLQNDSDMRELLEEEADTGDRRVVLAITMFCQRVRKCIGGYYAEMGGADAIVFAGGVGENSPRIRDLVCQGRR